MEQAILRQLNPDILCYRELWRAFREATGHAELFSSVLRGTIDTNKVHRIKSKYKPYHERKLCWLVPNELHEGLLREFRTTDYGRYLDFTRFAEIKKRLKLMHRHLIEEFEAIAKQMGLGVSQRVAEFTANGILIHASYWEIHVPGAGSFVLAFRQFNCRPVSLCDLRKEVEVAKALHALKIAGRHVNVVRANKIKLESRYPEVTPVTRSVPFVVVAPEVDVGYLRKVGVEVLYISGPRYVPGFSDPRSHYHGQVRTRRGLRAGLEIALRSFVFFLFKRRFPRARNAYIIFRMRRCGIVFERSDASLADFLPEKLARRREAPIAQPTVHKPP